MLIKRRKSNNNFAVRAPAAQMDFGPIAQSHINQNVHGLQLGLTQNIAKLEQKIWKKGKILYHGCTDQSKYTDVNNKSLSGAYKWTSEDPNYALNYSFYFQKGAPYLFVCELAQDVICIEYSQRSLHNFTNWGADAPQRFPFEFGYHAQQALGISKPVIFLDHYQPELFLYHEILITAPTQVLRVIKVIGLPSDRAKAKQDMFNLINS